VHHVSLNYGDLNDSRSGRVPPGAFLGSDAAGVVLHAANGGPAPGSRVVALARGAFAERVVADVGSLAEVPSSVDLAQAAALPVAGWLRCVRCGRPARCSAARARGPVRRGRRCAARQASQRQGDLGHGRHVTVTGHRLHQPPAA